MHAHVCVWVYERENAVSHHTQFFQVIKTRSTRVQQSSLGTWLPISPLIPISINGGMIFKTISSQLNTFKRAAKLPGHPTNSPQYQTVKAETSGNHPLAC